MATDGSTLLDIALVMPDAAYRLRTHEHAHHELLLVLDGRHRVDIAGERWQGDSPTALLLPAGTAHRPRYPRDRSLKMFVLQWSGGWAPDGPTRLVDLDGRLRQALRWMAARHPATDDDAAAVLAGLLRSVLAECRLRLREAAADDLPERIRHLLVVRLHHRIGMDELAQLFGRSPRRLHQIFNDRFGTSPLRYQADLRVEAAVAMLRDTDLDLTTIAERVGWSGRSHLARQIRRRYGVAPSALRG